MIKKTLFLNKIILGIFLILFNSNSLNAMKERIEVSPVLANKIYNTIKRGEERYSALNEKHMLPPLRECNCKDFNENTRKKAETEAVNTTLNMFPIEENTESNPLIYVSYQSGLLLQDLILLSKLIINGYKHFKIHFIDHICREGHMGKTYHRDVGRNHPTIGYFIEVNNSMYLKAKKKIKNFFDSYIENRNINLETYSIYDYGSADEFIEAQIPFNILIGIHIDSDNGDITRLSNKNKEYGNNNFFSLTSSDKNKITIIKYDNEDISVKNFLSETNGESWHDSPLERNEQFEPEIIDEPIIDINNQLLIAINDHSITDVWNYLNQGANPNAKYNDGQTALSYAISKNLLEIASILIESGANIENLDNDSISNLLVNAMGRAREILQQEQRQREEIEQNRQRETDSEARRTNIITALKRFEFRSVLNISETTNTYLEEDVLAEMLTRYNPGSPGFLEAKKIIMSEYNRRIFLQKIRRFISSNLLKELTNLTDRKLERARNNIYDLYEHLKINYPDLLRSRKRRPSRRRR